MYFCRIIATNFSKPSSFASTVTREQTTLDDPHGVFQRDRGGKCNNYQAIDLIVQDAQGNSVSLDYFVDLECALRVVMEDGSYGGVIDTVTRSSKRISSKHLEGQSGKLMVVDADPTTGSGIRIGGSSRTTVKVRINELSKKGSKNSRYSVCFRAIGAGSEAFCQDEDPRLCSTFPLTIYSKVVKTSNYLAHAAAANAVLATTTPAAATAVEDETQQQQKDDSDNNNEMEEEQQVGALPFPSPPTLMNKLPLSATGSSSLLSIGSSSTASTISDSEQIKMILDQVLIQLNSDQDARVPSTREIQVLNSISETCNAIQRKVEVRIQRANPPAVSTQQQQQQLLSQLDRDLMAKIPLNTFASMEASWLNQATNNNGNGSSWVSNPANASAIHAMFTSTANHSLASATVPPAADEHNQEKRLRFSPESSAFQKFLNSVPTFSTAFTSLTGSDVQQLQQMQQQQQHVLRNHSSSSSVGFEELKQFLDAKAENTLAAASAGGGIDREGVGMLFSALQYPVTDEICDWMIATFDANKDQAISLAGVKVGVQAREEELTKLYATFQAQQPSVELAVLRRAKLDPALLAGSKLDDLLQEQGNDNRLIGVEDFVALCMDAPRWNAAQALLAAARDKNK